MNPRMAGFINVGSRASSLPALGIPFEIIFFILMKDLPKFGIVRLRHYIYIFDVSI